jgi:hypothetical protein
VCAAAVALPFAGAAAAQAARAAAKFTPLTLVNGWSNYGFGTAGPAVRSVSGIVQLEGAIKTSGTNQVAFTLPAAFRPAADVYVKVDLCDAVNGRLFITPSGAMTVRAEGSNWAKAQCFTSLDGTSFAH